MGIFSKISNGLKKTKENFSRRIYELFKGRAIDDDFYDELEMALISADVGVTATEMIIDKLKDACYENRLKDTSEANKFFQILCKQSCITIVKCRLNFIKQTEWHWLCLYDWEQNVSKVVSVELSEAVKSVSED